MIRILKRLAGIVSLIFVFAGLAAFFATIRVNILWGNIYFEQLVLNLDHGALTAGTDIMQSFLWLVVVPAIAVTLFLGIFVKSSRWLLIIGLIGFSYGIYKFELPKYILNKYSYTDIYKNEYINPASINFNFPEQKRNLIVLYLESLEDDYANPRISGDNLLPKLSLLKKEAVRFTGFHQLVAQDYTIAAMVNSHCAVPYKSAPAKNYTELRNFLPRLICYPEVLKNNGYHTYFIKGASLDYTRARVFYESHGYDQSRGKHEIYEEYKIDLKSFQGTSWGYRDRTLYALAQKMLTDIARDKSPFVFTMLTLDTHGPDVYLDESCPKTFGDNRDIYLCADAMAADFINWIKQQDFYLNTTVVVIGDHTKLGTNELYPNHHNRQIVNFILNPAISTAAELNRKWTTIDLAPTILEALGIQFSKGKFGLGRSLFSAEPTLYEEMGTQLDLELLKSAKEYEEFNEIKRTFEPRYNPYPSWGAKMSSAQDILKFASFADIEFNAVWLDTLSVTLPSYKTSPMQSHVELASERNQGKKVQKSQAVHPGQINLNIVFRVLFMEQGSRTIKVYANKTLIGEWTILHSDIQPIRKSIKIPKNLIPDDGKLLIEFQGGGLGHTPVSVGVGVESFNFEEA